MRVDFDNACISIRKLILQTVIGCYRSEKDVLQPLWIDLDLVTDVTRVSETDDLSEALDYASVIEQIRALEGTHGCELLEAFSRKVVDVLRQFDAIQSFVLTIKKPNSISDCDYVSLTIRGDSEFL